MAVGPAGDDDAKAAAIGPAGDDDAKAAAGCTAITIQQQRDDESRRATATGMFVTTIFI